MAKPIIKTINPFDASQAYIVGFIWTGAMAYNNRMMIYDADTMLAVYDHTYGANYYRLSHDIPAGLLENGKKYAVAISVIDVNGDASEFSDKYYFWCMETPEFGFENLSTEVQNYVNSSTYTATLYYAQAESVPLSSFQFFLYNSTKELLDSSDVIRYSGSASMRYTYRSLENNTVYYLRATGTNTRSVPVDTGYILIIATYANPSMYARFYATPNPTIGTVDYYSNIVDIESDRPSSEYTFEEGFIDLTGVDPNKTIIITESNEMYPVMTVSYSDLNNVVQSVHTENSPTLFITGFSEVKSISIKGKSQQIQYPILSLNDYVKGSYKYVEACDLTIDGTLLENVIEANPLRNLPLNDVADLFTLDNNGKRVIYRNVGETIISAESIPIATGTTRNKYGRDMFTAYFDIGASGQKGIGNLICDALPVDTDTSCVRLTNDGSLAMAWDVTEFNITDWESAQAWLTRYTVSVLYPLKETKRLFLDPIIMPSMKNVNSVRYSRNFTIPPNATISVRMKEAFKTCEVLRVQSEGVDTFVLSSTVYDDGMLRYKLEVFGPASDYIFYSDPLYFHRWDIVTIHIRRIDGVYGMYVFVTEQDPDPKRNMWFIETEPPESQTERGDVWINVEYPTTYVDKDTVVRYYQDEKPTGAVDQNIWIGE